MNYIVLDLEATCKEDKSNFKNEIIEIGAVKLNADFEVVGTYSKFVRPVLNPKLTDFCKELTTIEQNDVDAAQTFPTVIKDFKDWVGVGKEDYMLCSWGFYDKKQFQEDCRLHKLSDSWTNKHISLKHQFAEIMGVKPCGMSKALRILNIKLDGTHHRGIDDAKNISKIFRAKDLKDKWKF